MPCYYSILNSDKVVELTTLWKDLTGNRGDRALGSTMRHLGIKDTPKCAFPDQPGHARDKQMPCANGQLLKTLLSGLTSEILESKQNFIQEVLAQLLGHDVSAKIESRFATVEFTEDSLLVQTVQTAECPRFVYFTVLKMFAPASWPSDIFYRCGVQKYLQKCGVSMPEGLATSSCAHEASANPSAKWSLDNDDITKYEKMLGAKSRGLIWGTSPYNNGEPALLGDFPIFVLTMMKLQTKMAREFKAQNLHQGIVMMGGNDKVALAISKHWRDERAAQPWNELLQFFGEAVEHEAGMSSSVPEQQQEIPCQRQEYLIDVMTAASVTGEPPDFIMNALSPEERSELIIARKKILADRLETAKKNAEAERIEAEAKQKEAEAQEVTVLRRAKLEKEADERKAAQDKALVRDENRVRAQSTRLRLWREANLPSLQILRSAGGFVQDSIRENVRPPPL